MIGLLWRLIFGRFTSCQHQWETKENVAVYQEGVSNMVYVDKHLRCTKCGT